MLVEFLQPGLINDYVVILYLGIIGFVPDSVGVLNDLLEVVRFDCSEYSKEEVSLRESVGVLIQAWEIRFYLTVIHGIVIEILH